MTQNLHIETKTARFRKITSSLCLSAILFTVLLTACNRTYNPVDPELVLSEQNDILIDGEFKDWKNVERIRIYSDEFGNVPDTSDLSAHMAAAWSGDGILLYFEVDDDIRYIHPDSCCRSDAVEVFISPEKGSDDIIQYTIPLAFDGNGNAGIYITDHRKKCYLRSVGPYQKARGKTENGKTQLEVFIATEAIGKKPGMGVTFSMQVYVNDPDENNDPEANNLKLYAGNFSNETSFTHYPVRLGRSESKLYETSSRVTVVDDKDVTIKVVGVSGKGTVGIYNGSQLVKKMFVENEYPGNVITLNPEADFNVMDDTLSVVINGNCIGFHNLLISPRTYVNTTAPPFYQSINIFRLKDKIHFPEPGQALFTGSSSMRMWGSVHEDFPELNIIHRGFGGSTAKDVLLYMNTIVLPYNPGMVVYYEGDNDIVAGIPEDTIINNMEKFLKQVRNIRTDVKIYFLAPKPSFARMSYWDQYVSLQNHMRQMIDTYDGVFYVDVSKPMFNKDGKLMKDIFCRDSLHMNQKGYKIWKQTLRDKLGLAP